MTTQSTGSLKGRLAGILIALIALPVLALAPAYLANRFAVQSPSTDGQATIQPSTADISGEQIHSAATTTNETPILPDEGFVVVVDDAVDSVRDADGLSEASDEPVFDDFSGEVVFLDTKSEEGCVFTLRVYSGDSDEDILTGRIMIDDDEVQSPSRDCNLTFLDEPNAH